MSRAPLRASAALRSFLLVCLFLSVTGLKCGKVAGPEGFVPSNTNSGTQLQEQGNTTNTSGTTTNTSGTPTNTNGSNTSGSNTSGSNTNGSNTVGSNAVWSMQMNGPAAQLGFNANAAPPCYAGFSMRMFKDGQIPVPQQNFAVNVTAPPQLIISENNCNSSTSLINVPPPGVTGNSTDFWVRPLATGTFTITGTTTSPTGVSMSNSMTIVVTDTSGGNQGGNTGPNAVQVSVPGQLAAGDCGTVSLTLKNGQALSTFGAAMSLNLNDPGAGGYYINNTCTGSPPSVFPAGISTYSFYYRNPEAGSYTITASTGGLSGSGSGQILPGIPKRLVLEGPSPVEANECHKFKANIYDNYQNLRPALADMEVKLNGVNSFFASCADNNPISGVSISQGNSSATFYVRAVRAGTYQLAPDILSGPQLDEVGMTLVVNASSANKLVLAPVPANKTTATASECSKYKVNIEDMYGNGRASTFGTRINFGTVTQGVSYYDNDSCSGDPDAYFEIAAGTSEGYFSYRNTKASPTPAIVSINALLSQTLVTASHSLLIKAASPSYIVLIAPPGEVPAGACGAGVIKFDDQFHNSSAPAYALMLVASATGNAKLYSDSNCRNLITATSGVAFSPGQATGMYYFRDEVAETFLATVMPALPSPMNDYPGPALLHATIPINVVAGPAARIVLTAPTQTYAGACSASFSVQSQDMFGNASPVAVQTPIGITGYAPGSIYSAANCAGNTALGGTTNIAANASEVRFYYMNTVAGNYQFNADGLGGISSKFTSILPLNGIQVAISGPSVAQAGVCTAAFAAQLKDGYNNNSPPNSAKTIRLKAIYQSNGNTHGKVYADAGCGTELPASAVNGVSMQYITIDPANAEGAQGRSASFYYKGTISGTETAGSPMQMLGILETYAPGQKTFMLNPGVATKLVLQAPTGSNGLVYHPSAGICSPAYYVRMNDVYGNLVQVPATANAVPVTMTLSGATASTARIYSAPADCPYGTGTNNYSIGALNVGKDFYFRNHVVGIVTVTATTPGLSPATLNINVGAGDVSQLRLYGFGFGTTPYGGYGPALPVNGCGHFNAYLMDAYGNVKTETFGRTITTSTTGTGRVYNYPSCLPGTGTTVRNVDVPANQGYTSFSTNNTVNNYHAVYAQFARGNLPALQDAVGIYSYRACSANVLLSATGQFSCWDARYGRWWFCRYEYYSTCDAYGNQGSYVVSRYRDEYNGGCFAPGSKVTMAGGLRKSAEEVKKGDYLWNPIRQQPVRVKEIMAGSERKPLIEFSYGEETLRVSSKHPMFTGRGVVQASHVKATDEIMGRDRRFHKLVSRRELPLKKDQWVYNFILDTSSQLPDDHALLSDGVVSGDWTLQTLSEKGFIP